MILLSILNLFMLRNNTDIRVAEPMTIKRKIGLFGIRGGKALPGLIMPFIVLGGIYGGIMTPTEAAAVAVLYSIPVGFFIYRGLNRKNFISVIVQTATTTGVVMLMMYCIMMLSRIFIMEHLPAQILAFLSGISENPYAILMMMNVFMVIIGMIMDDVSAMLLCTPVLLPVAIQIGVSPIHFAAIIGVNLGMGNVTPPTAPTLYFGARIAYTPTSSTMKPAMIFILFAWLPTLLAVTYLPELALWLPRLILGGHI